MTSAPVVAIAHDYLTQRGGAERVVLSLTRAFPGAAVYTTLYDPDSTYPEFGSVDVRPSHLNRSRYFRRHHRAALPFLAAASSSIQINADIVVCSSSGWAHGFRTTGQKLVYCYAPARWLYEPARYLGADTSLAMRSVLKALGTPLRAWDQRSASTADRYLAISGVTKDRIRETYGREARVVPAPHTIRTTAHPSPTTTRFGGPGYLLVVSRLLPYKNVDQIVRAFAGRRDRRLVVVGAGPQLQRLREEATPNTSFFEGLTDEEMVQAYDGCSGLVAASHEDFGLTPLEAAARGKPSAVLRWGGFLDTVVEDETGVFFDKPEPAAIADAVDRLLARAWDTGRLLDQAEYFSESKFIDRMRSEVEDLWMSPSVRAKRSRSK